MRNWMPEMITFSPAASPLDGIVIPNRVAERDRPLLRKMSIACWRYIHERLPADARDRQYRDGRGRRGAPDDSCLNQLCIAKAIERGMNWRFYQHTLDCVIDLLRNKIDLVLSISSPCWSQSAPADPCEHRRAFGGNIDIRFQLGVLVHRGQ